ncbi:ATP-binding protein [Aquiluna sp.]|nr:ATP-binding protein [Aquiluna sp.]
MSELKDLVTRVVPQKPDASLMDVLGNQHSLESALADLIDNSIQYGGTIVTVQLITENSKLVRIRVVDNGIGMTQDTLEEAMQLRKKTYGDKSLSHFGMGMKMASLSQAASMRVFTQSENGEVSGAQMRRADVGGQFNTEFLEDSFVSSQYASFRREAPGSGTVVEWSKIDDVSISPQKKVRVKWLNEVIRGISDHFGLIFHRFLEQGKVRLFAEIWDSDTQEVGSRTPAIPVDPFAFKSPIPGYPTTFYGKTPSKTKLELTCYMVPPQSNSESVKLRGLPIERWSGFYVYRNDRLVQHGGWHGLTHQKPRDLQFGRVKIELTDELIDAGLKLTGEKNGVRFTDDIKTAILGSKSVQLEKTFSDYLLDIESTKRDSSRRRIGLQPSVRIEGDENSILISAVEELIGFKSGFDAVEIVSVELNEDQVFEMDLENRQLRINSLLFEESGPLDSETGYEFIKATLYFLLEEHFTKTNLNKTTLHKIEQVHRVLAVSLGIQTLDGETGSADWVPTPAVIAGFQPPHLTVKPVKVVEEQAEIVFKPAWSSDSIDSAANDSQQKSIAKPANTLPASEPEDSQSTDQDEHAKAQHSRSAFYADPDLAKLGLRAVKEYKKSSDVASVAIAVSRTDNEVTAVLAQLLLNFDGELDNTQEAFLAGEPFNSSERERLISKYRDGQDLSRLSADTGRTCLHIAKEILDSPLFQLKVPNDVLKRLSKAANQTPG